MSQLMGHVSRAGFCPGFCPTRDQVWRKRILSLMTLHSFARVWLVLTTRRGLVKLWLSLKVTNSYTFASRFWFSLESSESHPWFPLQGVITGNVQPGLGHTMGRDGRNGIFKISGHSYIECTNSSKHSSKQKHSAKLTVIGPALPWQL